jgi:outer membrane lipoprotein-sorting protein
MAWQGAVRVVAAVVCGVLLVLSAAGQAPAAETGRPGAVDHVELERIESYLNTLTTMQGRFAQRSSNGSAATGQVFLSRPGRMRLDYDPPAQILLIADGTWLIYHDRHLDQISYIPLDSTPVSVLTQSRVALSGGDYRVTHLSRQDGTIKLGLVQAKDPAAGSVTLVFDADPITLRQWTVVDAQGVITDVQLVSASYGLSLKPELFRFKDPRAFQNR